MQTTGTQLPIISGQYKKSIKKVKHIHNFKRMYLKIIANERERSSIMMAHKRRL